MHRYYLLLGIILLLSCKPRSTTHVNTTVTHADTMREADYMQYPADTLQVLLNKGIDDKMRARQFAQAREFMNKMYPAILHAGHPGLLSTWWRAKGFSYLQTPGTDSAYYCLQQAVSYGRKIDTLNRFYVLAKSALSTYYFSRRQYDVALQHGYDAYAAREHIDSSIRSSVCTGLADIFYETHDMVNNKKYLEEALLYAQQPQQRMRIFHNLAIYYEQAGKLDSMKYYQQASLNGAKLDNDMQLGFQLAGKGASQSRLGDKQGAIATLQHALTLLRPDSIQRARLYLTLASVYGELQDFSRANNYIDSGIVLCRATKDYTLQKQFFRLLGNHHALSGNATRAYAAIDSAFIYDQLQDSLALTALSQELETRFAVKEKDNEIRQLAFTNKITTQVSQQRQFIIVALVLAALLLGVVGLLLFRRRQLRHIIRAHQLQQRLLRTQMEPHFIFNLLSKLVALIRTDQKEPAILYLKQFGKLAQISLFNASDSYVSLQQEVEALGAYLHLQQSQDDTFSYKITVYEGYEEDQVLIPPMLIQPFVENAVLHGVGGLEYRGIISVDIFREAHTLRCTIEDNGRGLPHRQDAVAKPVYATRLTQKRLRLLSSLTGHQASVDITDKRQTNEQGVKVNLVIPFRLDPPNDEEGN